jgi:hypothetical protein
MLIFARMTIDRTWARVGIGADAFAALASGMSASELWSLLLEVSEQRAVDMLTHSYYDGLRFMIGARAPGGEDIPLIDGGTFVWLSKLASNRKLVFVASALGSQLAAHRFRPAGVASRP